MEPTKLPMLAGPQLLTRHCWERFFNDFTLPRPTRQSSFLRRLIAQTYHSAVDSKLWLTPNAGPRLLTTQHFGVRSMRWEAQGRLISGCGWDSYRRIEFI